MKFSIHMTQRRWNPVIVRKYGFDRGNGNGHSFVGTDEIRLSRTASQSSRMWYRFAGKRFPIFLLIKKITQIYENFGTYFSRKQI